MPAMGLTVYVQLSGNTTKRVLHPTLVTNVSGSDTMTVLPEDQSLAFEVGQEFLIFFERSRQFMQQPAKVEALMEIEEGTVVALKTVGEPVSAEGRQCYRVSTALSDLVVTFGGRENCPLRDVSVSGFAVSSPDTYHQGQIVDAILHFEGQQFKGQASIQSIATLPDGSTRYGVNCLKSNPAPDSLTKGVQHISMAIQRQQLNRMAGGA